jgi:stearoyl-CoA desaturase (delta-9 desaturase)
VCAGHGRVRVRARCALTRARSAGGSQFALAWLGTASLQKGPLWWASHHRHHHRTADTRADAHSPVVHGFWWSHCGWFLLTNRHAAPLLRAVPDLAALPELRFLERCYLLPPAALAACLYAGGGPRAVAYGFFVATVLCWHATYAINSVAHLLGGRRFVCEFNGACTARNNLCAPLPCPRRGWPLG